MSATVTRGSTYTADLTVGDLFILTFTGNETLGFSGLTPGRSVTVEVHPNATGGRLLTLPAMATPVLGLTAAASTWETLVFYSSDDTVPNMRIHRMGNSPFTPICYHRAVRADSPWGNWRCKETNGSTLDLSPNSRDMTITGSPTLNQTGPTIKAIA